MKKVCLKSPDFMSAKVGDKAFSLISGNVEIIAISTVIETQADSGWRDVYSTDGCLIHGQTSIPDLFHSREEAEEYYRSFFDALRLQELEAEQ